MLTTSERLAAAPGVAGASPSTARSRRHWLAGATRGGAATGVLAVFVLAVFVLAVFVLALRASEHLVSPNSDAATLVLQGRAIAHRNPLLAGWALSQDSFWTLDAMLNAVGVAVVGVSARLLHVLPAVVATGLIVLGSAAAGRRAGIAGLAGAGAVVVVLALPAPTLAASLLTQGSHALTVSVCLAALVCLGGLEPADARANRTAGQHRRWLAAVALLALGLLGDLQTLALGVLPVVGAAGLAAARARRWRAGAPLATAALTAVLLALVVRWIVTAIGSFRIGPTNPLAGPGQLVTNLSELPHLLAGLFGVGDRLGLAGGWAVLAELGHVLVMLTVAVAAAAAALRTLSQAVRGGRRSTGGPAGGPAGAATGGLDDLLVCATGCAVGLFVVLSVQTGPSYQRYLLGAVVFATVLTGRVLTRLAGRRGALRRAAARTLAAGLVLAAAVATTGTVTGFTAALRTGPPPQPQAGLVRFLTSHHLDHGVGDYWAASIVTVLSGGRVTVRPVAGEHGLVARWGKESAADWYAGQRFAFLVLNPAAPAQRLTLAAAVASFGRPAQIYPVGSFLVLVWNHPIRVASSPAAV